MQTHVRFSAKFRFQTTSGQRILSPAMVICHKKEPEQTFEIVVHLNIVLLMVVFCFFTCRTWKMTKTLSQRYVFHANKILCQVNLLLIPKWSIRQFLFLISLQYQGVSEENRAWKIEYIVSFVLMCHQILRNEVKRNIQELNRRVFCFSQRLL